MGKRADREQGVVPAPHITLELLETCLDRVAKAIVRDEDRGVVYLPIYERLTSEIARMRVQASKLDEVRERVRRSLDRSRRRSC